MKRLVSIFLLILMATPVIAGAAMSNYCSAPPYVTRKIPPNLMILMDNSDDMNNEAYDENYDPNKTYIGYFRPESCYSGGGSGFAEVFKTGTATTANTSYTMAPGDNCPSAAPFRGNLLNWATMSRFDVLQKVLVGGLTNSRQANSHTLVATGGSWIKDDTSMGCVFEMSSGNLTISDHLAAGACSLIATPAAPVALSPLDDFWEMFSTGSKRLYNIFASRSERLLDEALALWDEIEIVSQAWGGGGPVVLNLVPVGNIDGTAQVPYDITFECSGNKFTCPENVTYGWTFNTLPAWLNQGPFYTDGSKGKVQIKARLSGTPPAPGTYPISVTQSAPGATSDTWAGNITIVAAALDILNNALPNAEEGQAYNATVSGLGGVEPYSWSATGLPSGLTIDAVTGVISGTPDPGTAGNNIDVTVTLTDNLGTTFSKVLRISKIDTAGGGGGGGGLTSKNFTVKVDVYKEPFTDQNGNNIWDLGESYTDLNSNGEWEGKRGIFQKFWDDNNPRARWGLTKYKGGVVVEEPIPPNNASSFFTSIQNAAASGNFPLASGLYGAINYFGYLNPYGLGYSKGNVDPIDSVPCRKNFVLTITSGSNVGGTAFSTVPSGCSSSDPLVKNSCFGFETDLRTEAAQTGKQNVYTYIVNTGGTNATNNAILDAAATAGGGKYYPVADNSDLEAQIEKALTDILAQAASGTAVSVLTTSSRGAGSMVQAYFLPVRNEGSREVTWTGYTQNIWTDLEDNLREDSDGDKDLELAQDKVVKIYHDPSDTETKAALFTTDKDGNNGSLATCSNPTIKKFGDISYLWEAGKKLALKTPNSRTLKTAKNVVRTSGYPSPSTTTTSFTNNDFTVTNVTGNATMNGKLNADADYSAANIVKYVRGECVETGVSGNTACGATPDASYRDRRVTVSGGDTNGNVWKLGDVISSTPKVFANTPLNTYHIDYGDSSYYDYVTDTKYRDKTSVAFVGANDGVLHAFRLGYLKDKGLTGDVKAQFKDSELSTAGNTNLGEELWGYIPFNAFPYLKYLATPGYCHIYFNDLSVRMVDASLGCSGDVTCDDPADARKEESWRTVLVGGMRFGGACDGGTPAPPVAGGGYSAYYAIDVTDPLSPVPLWEFSDADMGYATTYPSIIRTGAKDKNGNWYVVLGSGSTTLPKSAVDVARSTAGYVYILNLETGALVKKIQLDHNGIVGDILAIDKNKDYHAEQLFFGTSYNSSGWKGKLVTIDIPNQDLSSAWTPSVSYLFADNYPFTASPDATRDTAGNTWVYAGSGKYYSDVDEEDTADQVFVGLKDHSSTTPKTLTDLDDRTSTQTLGTVSGTVKACLYDESSNAFSLQDVVTSINPTSTVTTASTTGWYVGLTGGERVISRPLAVGGLVDFLTYKPSNSPCSYGGDSYLYAVGYTTGTAPSNVAIQSPETTNGTTTGSVEIKKGIKLGPGAPPTGEAIIIPPPKEGKEELKKKIQIATGVIVEAENKPVTSVVSKIVHWLKK